MHTLVLSLNPAVDVEWRMDHLHWEEKNTVLREHRWAGGKGVNVGRWLKFLGAHPRMLIPLGGAAGRELRGFLARERVPILPVWLQENSRVNVVATTAEGRQIRFNQVGPRLSPAEWQRVNALMKRGLIGAGCVICSGSLPAGAPVNTYARVVREAHAAGVRAIVDCDGPVFAAAVKARPFLVKPNEHELSLWAGRALRGEAAILSAARALSAATAGWVLVSRGPAGAMLVHAREKVSLFAPVPRIQVRNTVGAGDALLSAAAHQIELGAAPEQWLRWGVATASAAVQCVGGEFPLANAVRRLATRIPVRSLTQ
ncbi:MAG: hexose kinase [Verrucomicrobiota bacterium]